MANTPYHVLLAPAAQRQIRTLPAKNKKVILKLIEALGINPRPPGATKIAGMTGLYCEDANHHRLIYKVEEQEVLLLIVK